MTALDTNVLVRFVVQDDPSQAEAAAAHLEACRSRGELIFVPSLVLVETVWVLRRAYRLARGRVAEVVRAILTTQDFVIGDEDRCWKALRRFEAGRGDFSDYFLAAQSEEAGCSTTVTFDKALHGEKGFSAP